MGMEINTVEDSAKNFNDVEVAKLKRDTEIWVYNTQPSIIYS